MQTIGDASMIEIEKDYNDIGQKIYINSGQRKRGSKSKSKR